MCFRRVAINALLRKVNFRKKRIVLKLTGIRLALCPDPSDGGVALKQLCNEYSNFVGKSHPVNASCGILTKRGILKLALKFLNIIYTLFERPSMLKISCVPVVVEEDSMVQVVAREEFALGEVPPSSALRVLYLK